MNKVVNAPAQVASQPQAMLSSGNSIFPQVRAPKRALGKQGSNRRQQMAHQTDLLETDENQQAVQKLFKTMAKEKANKLVRGRNFLQKQALEIGYI